MLIMVDRYSLDRTFIATGQLKVEATGQLIVLTYSEKNLYITASGLNHPIRALENLRRQLAADFNSLLAINGCRVDTAYRGTGSLETYVIQFGKQAIKTVNLFSPTKAIDKLCTIEVHKSAYETWCQSLGLT